MVPGADAVRLGGRQHGDGRPGKSALDPAESKTPGMRRNSTRKNRETPSLPAEGTTAGREENPISGKSFMHGGGESYSGIVPAKQPNQGGRPPAEVVEGRLLAKENTRPSHQCQTPRWVNGPSELERVRHAAETDLIHLPLHVA